MPDLLLKQRIGDAVARIGPRGQRLRDRWRSLVRLSRLRLGGGHDGGQTAARSARFSSAPRASACRSRRTRCPGVRAALAMNPDAVRLTREHNDANVLALASKYTTRARGRGDGGDLLEHRRSAAASATPAGSTRSPRSSERRKRSIRPDHDAAGIDGQDAGRGGSGDQPRWCTRNSSARTRASN